MEYLTGLAARLAAESSNINTIRDLEKIYKEMVVSVENEDFDYKVELTLRFHRRILKDTGNNYLIRMVERTQLISSLHYEVMPLKQRMKASLESHRKILDAIIARDADQAEDLMRLHYRSAINLISDSFQKSEPVPVSYPAT
jgi:DNA-binding GntR family transcriptional regulator